MTSLGFLLVLTAALCHATWNFCVKRINAGAELVWLFSLIFVVLYCPVAIYFALGVEQLPPEAMLFIVGSTLLHLGYFLLLQTGYRAGDLSIVYPTARATGPLLSGMFAVLLLGEAFTIRIALGGFIIIGGVLMLTGGFRKGSRAQSRSLLFGIAAGTLIGSYTVWDAHAVATLMIPPLLLDYASSIGRVGLLAPVAWRKRNAVRILWTEHKARIMIIAVFNPLAYILALVAMTFTPVIYVAPIREMSVVFSVLAGSLLLGEGDVRHRLLWSVIILAGVAILATGG
ncbi:EamA-like transporter family protein [Cohaesibacter sp. ES.047]|uniref:DMT family transporter n=1 Tax=Cohaesibacter sp. ES.047 TaxID=1798205 RepID=UPI000BB855A1|nr:DMT family transporter [Cohaesibacter sp. ES.047]SNY93013.1 EamA-like transporter family protein [Cohaesibacter sp. ES.047]